jgi:hypothetical protein
MTRKNDAGTLLIDPERDSVANRCGRTAAWHRLGPYLSNRQRWTAPADYAGGEAWGYYLPNYPATSRDCGTYRLSEVGLVGNQRLAVATVLLLSCASERASSCAPLAGTLTHGFSSS